MVFRRGFDGGFSGPWPLSAKTCDSCNAVPALLFCRADSAFFCIACDGKVHGAKKLSSRHERVWMCEVCEQAPASVTCKADAAALCVACDADIHSANPLARRHERVPVVPFFEPVVTTIALSGAASLFCKMDDYENEDKEYKAENNIVPFPVPQQVNEEEASIILETHEQPWLLPNTNLANKIMETPENFKSSDVLISEIDPFLDVDYGTQLVPRFGADNSSTIDSVVPVQTNAPPAPPQFTFPYPPSSGHAFFNIARDYSLRPKSCNSYSTPSLSHSMSSSSLDVGVVPDGAEIAANIKLAAANPVDDNGPCADREARVLRYREKRKNRKFEKTIRYASRKAYAESRPRIKGRFAKRMEADGDMERIYSSAVAAMIADVAGYGVVPTYGSLQSICG